MAKPIRILFIDDSEDDVWLLLNELRKAHYEPTYERIFTPRSMEAALKQQTWDVIVCDYRMPGFSAPVALRILHESDLDIPFILVSGAILEETGVAVMRSGAHDYVMKDNPARFVPVIEREIAEALNRRELRKSEKRALRLGKIIDNSSNEIYVFNDTFIQVNRSAVNNLGYSTDELSTMRLLDVQLEISGDQLREFLRNLQSGEQDEIEFETVHYRKDGSYYPVEVRLHFSRSETPPVFIAIVRDISERKQAEKAIQNAFDRMTDLHRVSSSVGSVRTLEEILQILLNSRYLNADEVQVLLFESGKYPPEYYEVCAQIGAKKTLALGEYCPLASYPFHHLLSPDQSVLIEDVMNDERLSAKVRASLRGEGISSVMLFPMKNTTLWYGMLALHFRNKQVWTPEDLRHIEGLVDQVLIAIDNVLLLTSEAKARAEAEKANHLKLQFLAMISHELRTPLTSIKGFSTTLLAEDIMWDAETQRNFLSIINAETDKLTGLIEQLLDLSRLQAGTLSISPVQENFHVVLDNAMTHLQQMTQNHQFILRVAPTLPTLPLDSQRIAQVIENLVENAVKYSAASTHITLSVSTTESSLQVDVSDEGIGIPLQERDHIFEAFHQVKRGHGVRGAGLGLAICRGLIEAHGGRIWIQQTSEKGTTISFVLPIT